MAVGIVAFALVAILGLATMAVQTTSTADINGRLTTLDERLIASYEGQTFSNVVATLPATNYFDFYGTPTTGTGAYFCSIARDLTPTNTSTNYKVLQVSVDWPSPQLTSSNVFLVTVLKYQ